MTATSPGAPDGINWALGAGPAAIAITTPSKPVLLDDLDRRLAVGDGFAVATLNLDHVVKLGRNSTFRHAYAAHSHVVADGNPIVWLSRLAADPISLVPGSELVEPVSGLAARHGVSVAFFGSSPEVLAAAGDNLEARFPGLQIAARLAPPMGFDPEGPEADAAIETLGRSGARLCFLALGAPRQEIFAIRAQERLPHMGFLSIGAGLDFIAGTQSRAPAWVRALAAEWLWRLLTNPRRLAGRYAACIAVLPSLGREAIRARGRTRS